MALTPAPAWRSLWENTATDLELRKLIELINRRFRGKEIPTIMATSTSRPIWNDISDKTTLEDLIQLMNRRLSAVRIPMTKKALTITPVTTAATGLETILMAGQLDQTYHIGQWVHFQTGTHGNTWIPLIKRYVRRIQATAGGGGGYIRCNENLDPRALVDPKYGPTSFRLRARECMAVSFTNGDAPGAGAHSMEAFWGFAGMPNAASIVNVPHFPCIGFRCRYDRTAGGALTNDHKWRCVVYDDSLTQLLEFVTTVDCQAPHEFQLVFDGPTSTVIFFIDDVQVANYAFTTGVAPGQQTPYPAGGAPTAAGAWNMLWNSGNVGSATFVTEFCYHMSPATPLVVLEEVV